MLMQPFGPPTPLTREIAVRIAKSWWTLLLSGLVALVAGIVILDAKWTVSELATFVALVLIFQGLMRAITPPLDGSSRNWTLGFGVLEMIAGVVVLAWPGQTLLLIAIFIGASIVVNGAVDIVGSLANRHDIAYWWLLLITGLIEVPLGIYLLRRPGLTLAVAITVVGIWAVLIGILQIVLAFEIKNLPKAFDRIAAAEGVPTVD
ncbi:MAG: hypothetical protein JWL73_1628 [Actinomycetia bacterium]|nr:hypothetical protein [Actinomycetes bacterium]